MEFGETPAEAAVRELAEETGLIGFMQITLPLVLTPGSLLMGTIRHTTTGAPTSYELHHYTLDRVRTLRG